MTADHPGDIFAAGTLAAPALNVLAVDGDALPAGPPATGFGEPGVDDLDALSTCDPIAAGIAGLVAHITLGPGSPTLIGLGLGPYDILLAPPGGPPGPAIPGGVIGLVAGPPGCAPPVCDAIDALALDLGVGAAFLSLAPGSPTLGILGIGPEDLLISPPPFTPVVPFIPGGAMGLIPGDNLDALDIALDGDGDLVNDGCDNCVGVPNNDQLDSNADGLGDACTPTTTSTTTTTLPGPGIPVAAKKLIIIDKLTAVSKVKVVYVAKDPAVTKGAGTSTSNISATFDFDYANGSAGGSFVIPTGASNGTDGWVVNKATVAKYVNKPAPSGPTGAKVAVIKPAKLLKIVGKSLGDTPIDIFSVGPPAASGVDTEYTVVNGATTARHCTNFAGADCTKKIIAGGTGAKLVCKPGSGSTC